MSESSGGPPYYWCLKHNRVEGPGEDPDLTRMGPYDTVEEAQGALGRARARTEAWDEEERRWRDD